MTLNTHTLTCLLAIACLLQPGLQAADSVPNFNLVDLHDRDHELYRTDGKAVVLFFTGIGCPIARKSAHKLKRLKDEFESQGIRFWIINAYADETASEAWEEIGELGLYHFPYMLDRKQAVSLSFGVQRTAEVIAIETKDHSVFYRGAIDDQFAEGAEKPTFTKPYLKDALNSFLAGEEIEIAETRTRGCRVTYAKVSEDQDNVPDYATQVAPILQENCVDCHRAGAIGPWKMNKHRRVANYADMIEEVLLTRRMPPWDPHPDYGQFHEPYNLTSDETQTLIRWIQAGAPRGEGADPLEGGLEPLPDWPLGEPDAVLSMSEPQHVPAEGVIDYRYVRVESPFEEDVWLSGLDIKPGNRKVVHHVILYAKWPGSGDDGTGNGEFMIGWAPGSSPLKYPDGVAKRLPAKATLTFELHYTTSGSEQIDQSEIALYLAEGEITRSAETRQAIDLALNIQPGDPDAQHVATYAFKKPATIYGFFPHMHFRGKWMRYELLLPNGKKETLLHVPRYDFQWQVSYYPQEPIDVPAGAWLLVTGSFDNSKDNPANPDPNIQVHFGKQSFDEMFIGFFEAADQPEPAETGNKVVLK